MTSSRFFLGYITKPNLNLNTYPNPGLTGATMITDATKIMGATKL